MDSCIPETSINPDPRDWTNLRETGPKPQLQLLASNSKHLATQEQRVKNNLNNNGSCLLSTYYAPSTGPGFIIPILQIRTLRFRCWPKVMPVNMLWSQCWDLEGLKSEEICGETLGWLGPQSWKGLWPAGKTPFQSQ